MGHATRNANRARGIAENKASLKQMAGAMKKLTDGWQIHIAHEDPNLQLLSHEEIDGKIAELFLRLDSLEGQLNGFAVTYHFDRMPFWRRWWEKRKKYAVAITPEPDEYPETPPPMDAPDPEHRVVIASQSPIDDLGEEVATTITSNVADDAEFEPDGELKRKEDQK